MDRVDVDRFLLGHELMRDAMRDDDGKIVEQAMECGYKPSLYHIVYAIDYNKVQVLSFLLNLESFKPVLNGVYEYAMKMGSSTVKKIVNLAVLKNNLQLILSNKRSREMGDDRLNDDRLWSLVGRY